MPLAMGMIDLKHTKIKLRKDGIIEIICCDNFIYEIEHIKEIINATRSLTHEKKRPTVTIPGEFTEATKEALEFIFSKEATLYTTADAYIIKNLPHKIIGNFYLKFKTPLVPTKMFKDKKSALIWLKKFKD